ncbi:MAG: glycosyltransferase [Phycisphaeraceae bacterium]
MQRFSREPALSFSRYVSKSIAFVEPLGMRIALDATSLTDQPLRDETRSVIALHRQLAIVRPQWEITALHRGDDAAAAQLAALGLAPQRARRSLFGPRFDFIHTPHGCIPSQRGEQSIVSIDHLNPIDAPCRLTVGDVVRFDRVVRSVTRRADLIICPSAHHKQHLIDGYRVAPRRIRVVPQAVIEPVEFIVPLHWQEVLQRYGLMRPIILHYGSDETRRNTRRLIEAWALADRTVRAAAQLVIVGVNEASGKAIVDVVNRLGLSNSVRVFDRFAQPGDLSAMLSAADVAAIPTLSEGFPQQLLQAWTTRTAVLTSDQGSLAEYAGEAAVKVDPNDPCAIARGLGRLIKDARHRLELKARGEAKLVNYTWRAAAERFARVIEEAAGVRSFPLAIEADEPLRRAA